MGDSLRDRLDAVPRNMLRKSSESAPNRVRTVDAEVPNDVRKRGEPTPEERLKLAAHGRLLKRAARIAGFDNDKELAAELGVTRSQLSEWFSGSVNGGHPQTWRFEQHPTIGPALLLAHAHTTPGAKVEHVITLPALPKTEAA